MTTYQISCTTQEPVSRPTHDAHIVSVGTVGGVRWTVAEVYAAMDEGHTFFTHGPLSGKGAWVQKWTCRTCHRATLRSYPDVTSDNNLDNLPRCG
jgi:hypothetical protein